MSALKIRGPVERAIYAAAFAQAIEIARGTHRHRAAPENWVDREKADAVWAVGRAEQVVCMHRLAKKVRQETSATTVADTALARKPEPVVKTTPMTRRSRGRRASDLSGLDGAK